MKQELQYIVSQMPGSETAQLSQDLTAFALRCDNTLILIGIKHVMLILAEEITKRKLILSN